MNAGHNCSPGSPRNPGAGIHHVGLREHQVHWTGTVQESTVFVLPGEKNGHLAATMIRRGDRHV
jgi:hypothetical protein